MKKLLVLFIAFFAMAGVALADWTYLSGDQYGMTGVSGTGDASVNGYSDLSGESWSYSGGTDVSTVSGFYGGVEACHGAGTVSTETYVSVSAFEGCGYSAISSASGTSVSAQTAGIAGAGISADAYADGISWNW